MSNGHDTGAGFRWHGGGPQAPRGDWLRDLTIAIAIAVAAAFLWTSGDARAEPRMIRISGEGHTAMVSVTAGKSQDVHTEESFVNVTVGDPAIADVNPLTDHSLSILGKKIGTTRVSVYSDTKKLIGIFDIEVTHDVSRLTAELRRRFPRSTLQASSVNGRIMLNGDVADATTLDQAVAIARQFDPDFINSVSVLAPQQVLLEVRFIEISRTGGRELGVQWNRFGGSSIINVGNRRVDLPVTGATEAAAGVLSGAAPYGFLLGRIVSNGATTDVLINALEQKGIARSLAEPNLVALSGGTASFLAGGEYPIPVAGTFGQITVDYKKYGVGLSFTPTVLSRGLINMKIEPEVSQIDTTHSVDVVRGVSVPALIVRRASTTVELRDGQSFVIGGLLQTDNHNQIEQLPWLGTVPVLGALFSSKSYQQNQTDLVIIVTPHVVRPARPGDPIRSPADDTLPPNDPDFFLLGKDELTPKEARALVPPPAHIVAAEGHPFTGHMLDLPRGISDAVIQ